MENIFVIKLSELEQKKHGCEGELKMSQLLFRFLVLVLKFVLLFGNYSGKDRLVFHKA